MGSVCCGNIQTPKEPNVIISFEPNISQKSVQNKQNSLEKNSISQKKKRLLQTPSSINEYSKPSFRFDLSQLKSDRSSLKETSNNNRVSLTKSSMKPTENNYKEKDEKTLERQSQDGLTHQQTQSKKIHLIDPGLKEIVEEDLSNPEKSSNKKVSDSKSSDPKAEAGNISMIQKDLKRGSHGAFFGINNLEWDVKDQTKRFSVAVGQKEEGSQNIQEELSKETEIIIISESKSSLVDLLKPVNYTSSSNKNSDSNNKLSSPNLNSDNGKESGINKRISIDSRLNSPDINIYSEEKKLNELSRFSPERDKKNQNYRLITVNVEKWKNEEEGLRYKDHDQSVNFDVSQVNKEKNKKNCVFFKDEEFKT